MRRHQIEHIPERLLTARDRRYLGRMLAKHFDADPGVRSRAHWGTSPFHRVVVRDPQTAVPIAHASLTEMRHCLPHRTVGVSDVVVHPRWRGRGIAAELITAAVEYGRENGADVLLAHTTAGRHFERLGFHPIDATEVGLEAAPGWLGWHRPGVEIGPYRDIDPADA